MARQSRRSGPAADFELTAVNQEVPGLSITRYFDDGEIYAAFNAVVWNNAGATTPAVLGLFLDGTAVLFADTKVSITNTLFGQLSWAGLVPITAGLHTFSLMASGIAAAGDVIRQSRCTLSILQLPQYDFGDDIT